MSRSRKEIKLRPNIADHDFRIKVERARRFLADGHTVLVSMVYREGDEIGSVQSRRFLDRFDAAMRDEGEAGEQTTDGDA